MTTYIGPTVTGGDYNDTLRWHDDRPLNHDKQQGAHLFAAMAGGTWQYTEQACYRCSLWGRFVQSPDQERLGNNPLCRACQQAQDDEYAAECAARGVTPRLPGCVCVDGAPEPSSVCPHHGDDAQ